MGTRQPLHPIAYTKSAVMLTMVTAFGVKHNMYYDTIQSEITIDQLFT